jgi:hypothetical protein
MPAIDSVKEREFLPKELMADALYGSQENVEKAAGEGVKLISPTMGKVGKSSLSLGDFEFSDNDEVCRCPQGQEPVSVKKGKKGNFSAAFDSSVCGNCPLKEDCPVKEGKKYHYLRYREKSLRISQRRAEEQTEEFNDKYRWRAGVEATMSEYDTRTGVKHLRVRGEHFQGNGRPECPEKGEIPVYKTVILILYGLFNCQRTNSGQLQCFNIFIPQSCR